VNAMQDTLDYMRRLWKFRGTVRELKAHRNA
jgi:hypothetical protein